MGSITRSGPSGVAVHASGAAGRMEAVVTPGPRPGSTAPDDEAEAEHSDGILTAVRGWWRARPGVVVAVVAALAAGVAWSAYAAMRFGTPEVTWDVYGYNVVSDQRTTVTILVHRTPGTPTAVCRVRALDKGFAEVGSLEVEIPESSSRTVRLTVDIPTTRLAVTGTVDTCVVPSR